MYYTPLIKLPFSLPRSRRFKVKRTIYIFMNTVPLNLIQILQIREGDYITRRTVRVFIKITQLLNLIAFNRYLFSSSDTAESTLLRATSTYIIYLLAESSKRMHFVNV